MLVEPYKMISLCSCVAHITKESLSKRFFLWKMELVCDKIVCRIGGLKLGSLLFVLCKMGNLEIREAGNQDLRQLLELYTQLHNRRKKVRSIFMRVQVLIETIKLLLFNGLNEISHL